jgi:hypothetical protein
MFDVSNILMDHTTNTIKNKRLDDYNLGIV